MEKSKNDLRKRIYTDGKITIVVALVMGIVAIFQFIKFVSLWSEGKTFAKTYEGVTLDVMLKSAIFYLFICIVLVFFSLVLNEINKTGKPFSQKIISRLQIMAVLLMVSGVFPEMVAMVVGLASSTATFAVFQFDYDNVSPIIFGVCVGLVSEIFKYGYELQEDLDQIA